MEINIAGTFVRHSMQLNSTNVVEFKCQIMEQMGIPETDFYLTQNGRILVNSTPILQNVPMTLVPRLVGGKGGFGSMLRAIGAQIEKTTNRDACRDLSGRRLRDINEEQRLKRWFAKQEDREREREEQRQKKLEKLRRIQEGPALPLMEDQDYNKQRSEMADSVFEAVDKGFEAAKTKANEDTNVLGKTSEASGSASSSTESVKDDGNGSGDKSKAVQIKPKKKLKKTMLDEDLGSDVSSDDSDSEGTTK